MKTYQIALIIFVAVSLWMLSGLLSAPAQETNPELQRDDKQKAAVAVRVQKITAEPKQINIHLQGHTQAKRVVDITAQISGMVISTPVEKGQRVKKGDLLCQLAKEDRPAQVLKAKANVEQSQLDFDGSKKLYNRELISSSDLASKKAILKSHLALLEISQLNVQQLNIRAPFDGFVETRPADIGALMQRGQVCVRLIDEKITLATAQTTQKDVQHFILGQPAEVKLAGGRTLTSHLSFIGREANAVTRTYHIETQLENEEPVRGGISAQIIIPIQKVAAHHIPSTVLALNSKEELGVRIVKDDKTVQFVPTQVVAEDLAGVWVTGLPETIDLIVVGQEMVAQGEHVTVTYIESQE